MTINFYAPSQFFSIICSDMCASQNDADDLENTP